MPRSLLRFGFLLMHVDTYTGRPKIVVTSRGGLISLIEKIAFVNATGEMSIVFKIFAIEINYVFYLYYFTY